MKGFESGKDKVKKICDLLKRETIEPAQKEAEEIVDVARLRAEELVAEAGRKIEEMHRVAHLEIAQRKAIFEASLAQAGRQTLESLRGKIEHQFFNQALSQLMTKPLQDSKIVARLIEAVISAIEKEGLEADLSAAISSATPIQEVNELLGRKILDRLKEKSVLLSTIGGGAQVKIVDKNLTIDLSEESLQELVASYIRKDFREFVFGK
jgi:V/A-type H+-transporting ATPase subunit E